MTGDENERENRTMRPSKDEMGAENSSPTSAPPVDPERIAALIDGRLDADQRAALLAELDASPEAFEAFSDAVAALRDIDGDRPASIGGGTPPSGRAPRPFRSYAPPIALAAVILIAVALPLARSMRGGQLDEPRALAALVQPTDGSAIAPWSELRGSGDALSPRARAVRIGARIVELELLVRSRDTSAARVALQVAALLDGIPAGGVAASAYRSLAVTGTGAQSPAALGEAASFAEQVAGRPEVRAGAWLQAARVAAGQRNEAFFQSSRTRDAERAISSLENLPASARAALAELTRLLAVSPRDWPAVENALSVLLREVATG